MKVKDHFLTQETFSLVPTHIDGILRTTPLPANLDRYYESEKYISHHQDKGTLKEKFYKQAQKFNLNYKRNILVRYLKKNDLVLDYGCGAGEFLKFIENDFQILGYEPNAVAGQVTAEKIGKNRLLNNIEDVQDGSLNAITLWHVFEHIDNQEFIINTFYKKLKINGLLIIAVPNHDSHDAKYYKEHWAAYDVPRHVYHFTRTGMQQLFNNESWQMENIKPLLLDSYYISLISEKYRQNPLFWLRGLMIGAISNVKALKSGEFSSLIYIIRKI